MPNAEKGKHGAQKTRGEKAGRGKSRASVGKPRAGGGKPYRLRGRIWVDGPEGTFIGYGRVVLMERIREYGSITKAARSMEMSYRHAWELIDSMNAQAPEPFVVTSTGGRNGGGARVTARGEEAIRKFWKAQDTFKRFLEKEGMKFDHTED